MVPAPTKIVDSGTKFLTRLTGLYAKSKPASPAPISERTAILCSILFTVLYIAPFYLSPTLRATPVSSRDAPSVIQARVRAVSLTCIACSSITAFILFECAHASVAELLHLLGIWPASALDCVKVLGLVAILFVGPLYEALLVDGEWRAIGFSGLKERYWSSWTGYRNLVMAPLSEELVFRSLTIPLYLIARVNPIRIVFISPLIFGLAHAHHLVEFVNSHKSPGESVAPVNIWVKGIIRSLFQFAYTSLFGFFAAFVFLRTGSIWTAVLAHSFCNSMGFPRVWGRLGLNDAPAHSVTPDVAQGKREEDHEVFLKVGNAALLPEAGDRQAGVSRARVNVMWTGLYYVLLLAGAFGFYKMLWRLTESDYALASFAIPQVKQ